MKLFYWLTTSVIKVYGWHFFLQARCYTRTQESFICRVTLFIDGACLVNADASVWGGVGCGGVLTDGAIISCKNTRLGQEQLLQLHPLGRHVSPPPRVHMQARRRKATDVFRSSLTTLWILWHIARSLSSLSGTKTLIIGLIATAIFISVVILWWLRSAFNTGLIF